MLTLTNRDHVLKILGETLSAGDSDFKFVTDDGSYSTNKVIMFSIFPSLSSFLCMPCSTSHSSVMVMLPGVTTVMVEIAVTKICKEGDVTIMEEVLGFSADGRIGKQNKTIEHAEELLGEDPLKSEKKTIVSNGESSIEEMDIKASVHIANKIEESQERNEADLNIRETGHFNDFDNEDHYECEQCDFKTSDESEFVLHVKFHQTETVDGKIEKTYIFDCKICGKTFSCGWGLKRHRKQNHEKVRKCNVCNEQFVGLDPWSLHNKTCFFTCDQCDYKEKRQSRYEGHMRRHMREQNVIIKNNDSHYTQRITVVYK